MTKSEAEEKARKLSHYIHSELVIQKNSTPTKQQKFVLSNFYIQCWGNDIREKSLNPIDTNNLSCSLFGILTNNDMIIKIDIDEIVKAINNKTFIEYNFE